MNDQAEKLRNMLQPKPEPSAGPDSNSRKKVTRTITVSSGKGGVGKSNFTLNFALTLQQQGYQVLVFDADIGMANIDVLMGARPQYNLFHLLKREKTLEEIICTGNSDLQFIAGGSGFQDLIRLSDQELDYFAQEVSKLNGKVDFILFDTGAGLSKETLKFILAAEETIIVTTPEPTAMTDAYALIKMIQKMNYDIHFQLVINRITNRKEGSQTADKISLVAKQFLNLDIPTLGFVPDDPLVTKSVKRQIPFKIAYPNCTASKGMNDIVSTYLAQHKTKTEETSGMKGFLSRMIQFLK